MRRFGPALVILAAILAACSSEDHLKIESGALLATDTFEAGGVWEEGAYPADAPTPDAALAIRDGRYVLAYRASRTASFTWGTGGDIYADVIIEVEAEQLSDDKDNLYGVGCRLAGETPDTQTGYVFLISGDGHYGIAELNGQILTFDGLLPWRQSGAIRQGAATNTIQAACLGDTLALTVNGEFLGSADGSAYRRAGQIGFFAGADAGATIEVAFDNLRLLEGSLRQD